MQTISGVYSCSMVACFPRWFQGTKKVKAQGMGVHSPEEINEFGQEDLQVLSEMLADRPFSLGMNQRTMDGYPPVSDRQETCKSTREFFRHSLKSELTYSISLDVDYADYAKQHCLDVVVFAHLAQIYFIDKEVNYPLRDFMTESCPNLVGLVNRMKERCFPDWDDICTTLDLNSHLPKPAPEEAKDNKEESKDEKEGDKEKEPEEKDLEKEKADEKEKEKAKEKDMEENKEKEGK
ncbi:hypothetical protein NQ317_017181 [Molorchus minor]|uniref:Metaxin glutathione S-transferase domain-containing protein n=1 Tax=Molorchus minor TaxID=1323400 RepID=A0ABQ9J0L3_9CUCU|nr:hypothetical protein NQ317_017181 [Molorchus minor]